MPLIEKEREYESPRVRVDAKYVSPGPLIAIMRAASHLDDFFTRTPEEGYNQVYALIRLFDILRQEFQALDLANIFHNLLTSKVDFNLVCFCQDMSVVEDAFLLGTQP